MSKTIETAVDVNDVCRITEGTVIVGEITSKCDIRVDGKINGTLCSTSRIVVGEKAVIEGNIVCNNIDFWGHIKGDVYVKELLALKESSSIDGNIYANKLQVEMGAKIEGNCQTITDEQFETMKKSIVKVDCPRVEQAPAKEPVREQPAREANPSK